MEQAEIIKEIKKRFLWTILADTVILLAVFLVILYFKGDIKLVKEAYSNDSSIILFPELTLTGYSVGDLFLNHHLISSQNQALQNILDKTKDINSISIIGIALLKQNRLYNCAVVIQNGVILGVVPKVIFQTKRSFMKKGILTLGLI